MARWPRLSKLGSAGLALSVLMLCKHWVHLDRYPTTSVLCVGL